MIGFIKRMRQRAAEQAAKDADMRLWKRELDLKQELLFLINHSIEMRDMFRGENIKHYFEFGDPHVREIRKQQDAVIRELEDVQQQREELAI